MLQSTEPTVILDRYQLGEPFDHGGMGALFLGQDLEEGRPVAIKQLRAEMIADNPEVVERFAREAEALRTLKHPNIVKILATGMEGSDHYLVMEYVPGGSLAELLEREGCLSLIRALEITLDLCDALTRAHRLDIVHRDIKPANILLADDGTPRLTDFGMAYLGQVPRLTQPGMTMGTVDYLSPEACRGEECDARTDIWGLGVVLFQMLTGQRPFSRPTLAATLSAILAEPTPDLKGLRPEAPDALATLINGMLNKERGLRIGSVRRVGAELEAIMRHLTAERPATREASKLVRRPLGSPLLRTKLQVPIARSNIVSRPRLIEKLNSGLADRLTLISAPAGFGKTTLLGEYVAGFGQPVAWVSLDKEDNDPLRFLSYVIAALQRVSPGIGQFLLGALSSKWPPYESVEVPLTGLINELANVREFFVLILDDYHLITASEVHEAVAFLVDNMPPQMHLIVSTRSDPPWPLARLRMRRDMTEFRSSDLRFTLDEVTHFLNKTMGLELSVQDIAALDARIEGWIAGLQLAALSMQGRTDLSGFIRSFSGSHRFVLDYLVEEVLDRMPKVVQDFCLETSILERLTASLCDAVTGLEDSREILRQLEQDNMFLVPLDDQRTWFRYHRLLAELLRSRLQQSQPTLVPELRRRASTWHEQNGMLTEAIGYAVEAEAVAEVARLVEENALTLIYHGHLRALIGWLDALPAQVTRSWPWLCLAYAWALAYSGEFDGVEPLLEAAEQAAATLYAGRAADLAAKRMHVAGQLAAIRGYVANFSLDLPAAVALNRQALAQLPEHDLPTRGFVAIVLASVLGMSGDVAGSLEALSESLRISRQYGDDVLTMMALSDLAAWQIFRAELRPAHTTCQEALAIAREHARRTGQQPAILGFVYARYSAILREWDQLDAAEKYARQAVDISRRWGQKDSLVTSYLNLARILRSSGDLAGAFEAIQKAKEFSPGFSGWMHANMAIAEAQLSLASGDVAAAGAWARDCRCSLDASLSFQKELEHRTYARVLMAQGKGANALPHLARLLELVEEAGAVDSALEILILKSLIQHERRQTDKALATLSQALAIAEPQGYVRKFVDEGPKMGGLLRHMVSIGSATDYVKNLLAVLARDTAAGARPLGEPTISEGDGRLPEMVEPLSDREHQVLRLLAANLTSPEVAEELVIAVSTVRSHVKSIYSKLGVHSRHEAIERAQELHLI